MLYPLFIACLSHIENYVYENLSVQLLVNLACDKLKILLNNNNNINLICADRFDYSMEFSELFNYSIEIEESINFINKSNNNILHFPVLNFNEIFKTNNKTKIIFTDFLNITVVEAFSKSFSSSYQNVLVTMNWNDYMTNINGIISYCQWSYLSESPAFENVKKHFDEIAKNSRWKKVCLNSQAFLHFVPEPQGEIIMIPYSTMVILIVFIVVLVVGILVSLYLIALWKYRRSKIPVSNEYSDGSLSNQDNCENKYSSSKCESNNNYEINNNNTLEVNNNVLENKNNNNCEIKNNVAAENKNNNDNYETNNNTLEINNNVPEIKNNDNNYETINNITENNNSNDNCEANNNTLEVNNNVLENNNSNDNCETNNNANEINNNNVPEIKNNNDNYETNNNANEIKNNNDNYETNNNANEIKNNNDNYETNNNANEINNNVPENKNNNDNYETNNNANEINNNVPEIKSNNDNYEVENNSTLEIENNVLESKDNNDNYENKNNNALEINSNDNYEINNNYFGNNNNNSLEIYNDYSENKSNCESNDNENQYSIDLINEYSSDDQSNFDCCSCLCCENCKKNEKAIVFGLFMKQLLGIGNSAGSIVSEAIHLLRIFQRLSATKTFSVHFSKDCLKMFAWATNLIEIIFANFYLRSFYDIELFYVVNYIFPILMITFMVLLFLNYKFYILLFISAAFTALGFAFGYIQYDVKTSMCILFPALILDASIIYVIYYFFHKYGFSLYSFIEFDQYTVLSNLGKFYLPFSFTVFNTLIITAITLIPFFINDSYFLGTCIFVFFVLIVISFIIDMIIGSLQDFVSISVILVNNLPFLFTNILTLLFVPSTDLFTELMLGEYKNNWNCIIGFIVFALALPALITLLLIFFENPDLFDKYRDHHFVYYEFIDMARQIVYAFVSAYDKPWACIIIEICWIFAFSLPKIYNGPSEYVLQGGSSLIIITGNTIALVCEYTNKDYISFKWFLFLICAACFLAIIAFYVYFIIEFEIEEEDKAKKEDKVKISMYMTVFFTVITPFIWFFFGLFIPIIMDHFNKFNSNYHEL